MNRKEIKPGIYVERDDIKFTVFEDPQDRNILKVYTSAIYKDIANSPMLVGETTTPQVYKLDEISKNCMFWETLEKWEDRQKCKFYKAGKILINKKQDRIVCTLGKIISDHEDEDREKFHCIVLNEKSSRLIWFYTDYDNWEDVTDVILDKNEIHNLMIKA